MQNYIGTSTVNTTIRVCLEYLAIILQGSTVHGLKTRQQGVSALPEAWQFMGCFA